MFLVLGFGSRFNSPAPHLAAEVSVIRRKAAKKPFVNLSVSLENTHNRNNHRAERLEVTCCWELALENIHGKYSLSVEGGGLFEY